MKDTNKPKGYENDLSEYGPQIYDGYCGEPIGWGFKILNHLGEERFNGLYKFGDLECVNGEHLQSIWSLIVKHLTREEAAEKYGAITNEEFGPRGGFRSVTFGDKKFISRGMMK